LDDTRPFLCMVCARCFYNAQIQIGIATKT
jgi:hypothetical protein